MDTNHETALSKAHHHLAGDLEKLAQLIDPLNSQALAKVSQAHTRLTGIEELVKLTAKPSSAVSIGIVPDGFVGALPDDTLAHVSDVLEVLSHLDYDDCGSNNDFTCGMIRILNCARTPQTNGALATLTETAAFSRRAPDSYSVGGSSQLNRGLSAPVTGSPAGSSKPTCTSTLA